MVERVEEGSCGSQKPIWTLVAMMDSVHSPSKLGCCFPSTFHMEKETGTRGHRAFPRRSPCRGRLGVLRSGWISPQWEEGLGAVSTPLPTEPGS